MRYNLQERLYLIKNYIKSENITVVQRAWRAKYKNKPVPSYSTIQNMVSSFEKTGSVMPMIRPKAGPSAKRQEAKTLLEKVVAENISLSTRKAASVAQISHTLAGIVLRQDLAMKPYKLQYVHKLLPIDNAKRLDCAEWFLAQSAEIQQNTIFSDEAYFYLTLPLNKQNNRLWSKSNPDE